MDWIWYPMDMAFWSLGVHQVPNNTRSSSVWLQAYDLFRGHFGISSCTQLAQREGQFSPTTERQLAIVQSAGWQHFTLDQSRVLGNICSLELWDDFGMVYWVNGCLVDLGVQGHVIDVLDFIPRSCTTAQWDGVSPSTAKAHPGLSRTARVCLQLLPLAFPHFHHTIPLGSKQLCPFLGKGVRFIHHSVQGSKVGLVTH